MNWIKCALFCREFFGFFIECITICFLTTNQRYHTFIFFFLLSPSISLENLKTRTTYTSTTNNKPINTHTTIFCYYLVWCNKVRKKWRKKNFWEWKKKHENWKLLLCMLKMMIGQTYEVHVVGKTLLPRFVRFYFHRLLFIGSFSGFCSTIADTYRVTIAYPSNAI